MRIQTSYTIFGYPALAILCFLAAAGGGFWLLFSIFFQDEKIKKKEKNYKTGSALLFRPDDLRDQPHAIHSACPFSWM